MRLNENDVLVSEQYLLDCGEDSTKEYLRSKRYLKRRTEKFETMEAALDSLKTGNRDERYKSAGRLLRIACAELGLTLIEREWYFDEYNKTEISNICINESDDRVLEYLLLALSMMYERYIAHPMWEKTYNLYDPKIEKEYKQWIFSIANQISSQSIKARMAVAKIYAICNDKRSWDIYIEILPRRSAYVSNVWHICRNYAQYSMTEEQRIGLIQVFENLSQKVKRTEHYCVKGIEALQELKIEPQFCTT